MRLTRHYSQRKTRQTQPVPGARQVRNSAGGHVWAADRWAILERLLILGTEGGTYYVNESKLTVDQAENLRKLIDEDGPRVVSTIAAVSRTGRAPKNDPALFALAMTAAFGDDKTKQAAYAALPSVARTGTHLFQFAAECEALRGWGRGLRKAVSRWYTERPVEDLVYQMVKYRQRQGWTHADLLRLAHPKTEDARQNAVFKWAVDQELTAEIPRLQAFVDLQKVSTAAEAARLVSKYDLPREAVPSQFLNASEVWEALLPTMPLTALLRNLANLTRLGLIAESGEWTKFVADRLVDEQRLKAARIHPLAVLLAQSTYRQGQGIRSEHVWNSVPTIVEALEQAFHLAFQTVEPTGLRHLLALDVSGSMTGGSVAGTPMTPHQAAAAMAMVTVQTEPAVQTMAFSHKFKPLKFNRSTTLAKALKLTHDQAFGRTDCALPMVWAKKENVPVDVFVVYTDNETWYGDIHPFQALQEYRDATGINAKLAVVALTASKFTIADPRDPGMLDIVGFDTTVPPALREFSLG